MAAGWGGGRSDPRLPACSSVRILRGIIRRIRQNNPFTVVISFSLLIASGTLTGPNNLFMTGGTLNWGWRTGVGCV